MATILVVDDLLANRALLVAILSFHGHRLIEAEDGREGLAAVRAEHPDLVITDVLMPVMDGFELVRQLRIDPLTCGIPIVFCTAHYGEREARELALSSGVSDVLTKPVDSETLLAVVERALSGLATAGPKPVAAAPIAAAFDREHLRLMTDKLSETADGLREANARLRAVINIGLELASERDSDRLLSSVCAAAHDLFAPSYVTLGILDRADGMVQRMVSSGAEGAVWLKTGDAITGILRRVVAERRALRGENPGGDPAGLELPSSHPVVHAYLAAPIASPAHVYGWICLVGNDRRPFTEEDESLMLALGGQIGRTYENGHLGQHDFLTDLPNRMLLNDRVTQAIALARRSNHRSAILFFDLDRFKRVNDSLGHAIGDLLLQSVAQRLVSCVRSSDTVSRQGGDEFVVLLSAIQRAEDAAKVARKILTALIAPHEIGRHQLHQSATIGISIFPDDGGDADTLIRCADIAMYHAKESGPSIFQFFEPEMNARAVERQWVEAGLHRALARGEFVLHYQPRIDLKTGTVTGAEALIRWVNPERGLMPPKDFVPIAEDCGLIVPIGEWVLAEACMQMRTWINEGRRPIPVAVNISAVEFRDPRFLDKVRGVLHDNSLDARYLELELTESSLIQDVESATRALQALKDMGIQVAIDDFGTGYSSLSYLRQFPTTVLKLDQSFVQGITDPVGTAIACAVITVGKSLGQRVIAEGVDTQAQLRFLQAQGCDEAQGFYFSRALVADQFVALIDTRFETGGLLPPDIRNDERPVGLRLSTPSLPRA
jgi:diguanylate cyclase (GGDEF)-like protein